MSYSIMISGHKEGLTTIEETEQFHDQVLDMTKEFVSTLEGVSAATMNGRSAMPSEEDSAPS